MRILFVDDEVELARPIIHHLTQAGYTVDVAHDGDRGYDFAIAGGYSLLILDWMLPHRTGLDICQALRSRGDATPVLFLTAKDTLDDRVAGLDAGADDYLMKPFELRELMARVRALLRRSPTLDVPPPPARAAVHGVELDAANQLAYRGDRVIELSEKEAKLLDCFLRSPNQVIPHHHLQESGWGTLVQPSSNVLAAQIRLLRRKLDQPDQPSLIHTVYGKGYRFGLPSDGDTPH